MDKIKLSWVHTDKRSYVVDQDGRELEGIKECYLSTVRNDLNVISLQVYEYDKNGKIRIHK